jgi:hypothetical protein
MERDNEQQDAGDVEPEVEEDDMPLVWEGRVLAVALVWVLPGLLLGGIVGLFLPSGMSGLDGLLAGGLIGAVAGALLEADYWP